MKGSDPAGDTADRLDPSSPVPKHSQLRAILLKHVVDALDVGQPIPSERDLSLRYGLSRMTVRQAVDTLVLDGRLHRVPGKGTFVARPKLLLPLRLASFTDDMRARGMRPGAVDLGHRVIAASPPVAGALGLVPGALVCVVTRLRTADGAPMAVERSHLPDALVPELATQSLADRSLYALLAERYGVVLDRGEQTIEAAVADEPDAQLLGIRPASAVLHVQRRSFAAGNPVEYAVSTYRGDRYQLRVALDDPLGATPAERDAATTTSQGGRP